MTRLFFIGEFMGTKQKFYAVRIGRNPGIYRTWSECQKQIMHYKEAEYKSFKTLKEAEQYLAAGNVNAEIPDKGDIPPENECWAFIDGSFIADQKAYGYGGVLIYSDRQHAFNGGSKDKALVELRNVAGEMSAAMRAVQDAIKNRMKKITLFYDYKGVRAWAKGEWKRNNEYTQSYHEYMQKAAQRIAIEFVKVPAHEGIYYNEYADRLAKNGAKEA